MGYAIPTRKNDIDFSSTANEYIDEDDTALVGDAEKMQDTHRCTLRGPGEELGWNERVTKRQIVRAYKEKLREKSMPESMLHDRVISAFGRFLDVPGYGYDGKISISPRWSSLVGFCGFADVFFSKEKHLTHGVGDFWRLDEGGHAIFVVVDECDVVSEDINFYRRAIFVWGEKSAGK